MNRKELLRLVLNQAQFNGFEFRRWFQAHVKAIWPGADEAITLLSTEGRHATLLYSHEFASCFWRSGAHLSFMVPATTYSRVNGHGGVVQVTRKPFTRRKIKPDVWRYHLQQMAIAENPFDYLCRFLPAQDQVAIMQEGQEPIAAQA